MSGAAETDELIRRAIADKRLLEFRLHGLRRVVEPHLFGIHKGVRQLLAYQVGGDSKSGGLPDWRRADLSAMSEIRLLDERFPGPRLPVDRHVHWDAVLSRVE